MTAINACCSDDELVMVSDSGVYTPTGEIVGWTSKVFPLWHLDSAVAWSGNVNAAIRIYAGLSVQFSDRRDFGLDETLEALPALVTKALDGMERELLAEAGECPEAMRRHRLFIGGYSHSRGVMELYCMNGEDGEVREPEEFGTLMQPHIPGTDETDAFANGPAMLRYMERQRRWAAENLSPDERGLITGQVYLLHATRDGMNFGRVAELGDFEARLAQMRQRARSGAVVTLQGLSNDNRAPVEIPAAARLSRQQRRAQARAGRR